MTNKIRDTAFFSLLFDIDRDNLYVNGYTRKEKDLGGYD